MTRGALSIVGRELRVAARRKGTYIARCTATLAVVVLGAWFFVMMRYSPPGMLSQGLFSVLSGASLLFAYLGGIYFTSDSISEEKREGTLGLLFLTDLKGSDVVLGKLAATSLSAFYGLLAMLPMLAIPLLIGGVGYNEVLRMSLLCVNTMFVSLTAGLFVSSISRSPRHAAGMTFALLAVFAIVIPLLGTWATNASASGTLEQWWLFASPGYAFFYCYETNYVSHANRYWICMGVLHALSWIWLISASILTPRAWKEKPVGSKLGWRDRLAAWNYGAGARRAEYRARLLGVNPFYWLASRSLTKPSQVWGLLAICAALWFWGWAENQNDWLEPALYIATCLVMNLLLKGWFAAECTRQVSEDRHRGSLELMLTTPLSIREILDGQRLALQRQFAVPMVLVLLTYLVFMVASVGEAHERERVTLQWLFMLGIVIFIADLIALYWVGIWMALNIKRPNLAPTVTCLIVLALPWVLLATGAVAVESLRGPGHPEPEHIIMGVWAITALGVDILAIALARNSILSNFRRMAVGRSKG